MEVRKHVSLLPERSIRSVKLSISSGRIACIVVSESGHDVGSEMCIY